MVILFVIMITASGITMTSAEFSSADKCATAGARLSQPLHDGQGPDIDPRVFAYCVEK